MRELAGGCVQCFFVVEAACKVEGGTLSKVFWGSWRGTTHADCMCVVV